MVIARLPIATMNCQGLSVPALLVSVIHAIQCKSVAGLGGLNRAQKPQGGTSSEQRNLHLRASVAFVGGIWHESLGGGLGG